MNLVKRMRAIERYLELKGRRVVDCGCGAGEYVSELRGRGANAWGIEFSQEKLARSRSELSGHLTAGDLGAIALRDGTIDVALLNEVLEHVPDDRRVLGEVHRILRPGGALILFAPNRRCPFETHGAKLRRSGRRIPHYIPFIPYLPLRLSTAVIDFWARNYWPGELRRVVTAAGFDITHTDFVWQTFEGISNNQPRLLARLSGVLRRVSNVLEQVPIVRTMGVSQVIVAMKRY